MVASSFRQHVSLPVAPLAAAVIGVLTATVFALMPTGNLESIVLDSGIAAMVPAAAPPLGLTARAVLICAGGGGIALIAWLGLFLLVGTRLIVMQRAGYPRGDQGAPVLRRADAHPDAPPRRPVFANRDLGTPFLEIRARRPIHVTAEVPAESLSALIRGAHFAPVPPIGAASDDERGIPANLDVPLAAYDPDSIPQKPIDWFPQPASPAPVPEPRRQVFDPGERFETFELTPPVRPAEPTATEPLPESATPSKSPPESGFACAPEPAPESRNKPWPVPSAMPASRSAPLPIAAETPVPVPVPTPAPAAVSAPATVSAPASAPVPASHPARRAPIERPDPSATIHALLDRLERSVARLESPPPPPPPPARSPREESLQEALVTLRRLASRG